MKSYLRSKPHYPQNGMDCWRGEKLGVQSAQTWTNSNQNFRSCGRKYVKHVAAVANHIRHKEPFLI